MVKCDLATINPESDIGDLARFEERALLRLFFFFISHASLSLFFFSFFFIAVVLFSFSGTRTHTFDTRHNELMFN